MYEKGPGVGEMVGVSVGNGLGVRVGVSVAVDVSVGVNVGEGVKVRVAVGVSVGKSPPSMGTDPKLHPMLPSRISPRIKPGMRFMLNFLHYDLISLSGVIIPSAVTTCVSLFLKNEYIRRAIASIHLEMYDCLLKEEKMRNHLWIAFVVLVLTACNLLSDGTPPTPIPTLELVTPTTSSPTPTLVPIETLLALPSPTFAPTSTSEAAIVSPLAEPVNCRYGPSVAYLVIGGLDVGAQAEMVGRSADSQWWYVRNPSNPSINCWLSASVTETVGNVEALPVVEAPLAIVTKIDVQVNPITMSVPCASFPNYVTATAEIFTNGPTNILWRWESSEGEIFDKDPLLYLEGSSQLVQLYYRVNGADNYWLDVHILSPNDTTSRAYFKITCVP